MRSNFFRAQSPGIEAEKRTLVLAALKLLLFLFLISLSLGEIILLTGDSALYTGKGQFIAWHFCVSLLSLAMILDASYVLGKHRQSGKAGTRPGFVGSLLEIFILPLSPLRIPGLMAIAAVMGLLGCAVSLLLAFL